MFRRAVSMAAAKAEFTRRDAGTVPVSESVGNEPFAAVFLIG